MGLKKILTKVGVPVKADKGFVVATDQTKRPEDDSSKNS